jgi:hypothetical protein
MPNARVLAVPLLTLAACGGGGGSSTPRVPPNEPPVLQVPAGLGGTAASLLLVLPVAQTQSLMFTASDPEGGTLTWQVSTNGATAAAAGVAYTLPHQGQTFSIDVASAVAPVAADLTILVEDPNGAAAAVGLRVLRSGPPTITGVAPGSAFTTRPQRVTITGSALQLGGSAQTTVSFGGVAGTGVTAVDDHTVTCATPAAAALGPTVVAVGTQWGSAFLPSSAFTVHAFPPNLLPTDTRIDAGSASSPAFARERDTVHAVWLESTSVVHRVSIDRGASWSAPQTLSGVEAASEPQLLAAGNVVLVAWIGDNSSVLLRRSDDGGVTFAPVQRLDPLAPVTPARRPRLAQSGAYRYAAWVAGDTSVGAGQVVAVSSSDAGVAWTAPNTVAPGGSNQQNHDLACDGATAWVVLEDDRLGAVVRGAYVARTIDNGTTWLAALRLNSPGTAASSANVRAAGNGVFATWLQVGGLSLRSSSDHGATWANTVVELQPGLSGAVTEPAVACDDTQLVAAFVTGGNSIGAARFTLVGANVQRVTIESAPSVSAEPCVAIDGNYVFVAWREGDVPSAAARVQFAVSTSSGAAFEVPAGFGDGLAAQVAPHLVVDGANLLFAWIDARGATNGVFTNRTAN